jgi:hypothetical protein
MKKIFIIIVSCVLCILAALYIYNAQKFEFKGVSLNKKADEFIEELKDKNVEFVTKVDGIGYGMYYYLIGSYAGRRNCNIFLTSYNDGEIELLGVHLPAKSTWSSLEDEYYEMKELLTKKYGKPYSSEEEFIGYEDKMEVVGNEMEAIEKHRIRYYTTWEMKVIKNTVRLYISEDKKVVITYSKYFDGNKYKSQKEEDI